MKRKSLDEAVCPIARSLDQVGEWWSLLIVRDVAAGHRRFGELLDSLGVARNMLSARLKRLIACGVLELRPARDGTSHKEYELTAKGRDLLVTLAALGQWGRHWTTAEAAASFVMIESATGEQVASVEVHARDGRTLSPAEISIVPAGTAPVSVPAGRTTVSAVPTPRSPRRSVPSPSPRPSHGPRPTPAAPPPPAAPRPSSDGPGPGTAA